MVSDSLREKGGADGLEPGRFWGSAAGKRGADLLARLVSHGARGVRVRRLGGTHAGEIRFTRFLRNPSVTPDEMIASAFARTQGACAGRDVLAIQDTTVTRSSGGGGSLDARQAALQEEATISMRVSRVQLGAENSARTGPSLRGQ